MKRTGLVNKLIVKAFSVSLTAMLAMSPIVAFAETADSAKTNAAEETNVVIIEDEGTALAPSLPSEERAKISWCWLMVAAVFGTTGYVWYRNQQRDCESEEFDF